MSALTPPVPRAAVAIGGAAVVAVALLVAALVAFGGEDGPAAPRDVVGLLREDGSASAASRADVRAAVEGLRASGPDGRAAADAAQADGVARSAAHGYTVFSAGDRVCIGGVGSKRQYACAFSDTMRDGKQALAVPVPLPRDRTRMVVLVADGVGAVRLHTDRGTTDVPVRDNLAVGEVGGKLERVTWKTSAGDDAALALPGV